MTGGSPANGSVANVGYVRLRPMELGFRGCFGVGCEGDGLGVRDGVLDIGGAWGAGDFSSGIDGNVLDWELEGNMG